MKVLNIKFRKTKKVYPFLIDDFKSNPLLDKLDTTSIVFSIIAPLYFIITKKVHNGLFFHYSKCI